MTEEFAPSLEGGPTLADAFFGTWKSTRDQLKSSVRSRGQSFDRPRALRSKEGGGSGSLGTIEVTGPALGYRGALRSAEVIRRSNPVFESDTGCQRLTVSGRSSPNVNDDPSRARLNRMVKGGEPRLILRSGARAREIILRFSQARRSAPE